jgi:hypothetical protein
MRHPLPCLPLLLALPMITACQGYDDEVNDLQAQIDSLDTVIKTQSATIAELESLLASVSGSGLESVKTLASDVASAQADIADIQDQINDNEASISTNAVDIDAIEATYATQSWVNSQGYASGSALTSLSSNVGSLEASMDDVDDLMAFLTVGSEDIYIDGASLHIRNGTGNTAGPVNGTGNLIVGYNETSSGYDRTGSHNLVIGSYNQYSSYAGIIAGYANQSTAAFASVLGGVYNNASGPYSFVGAGYSNEASGNYSAVLGGHNNDATGTYESWYLY